MKIAPASRLRVVVALASLAALFGCGGGSTVTVGAPPSGPEVRGQVSMPDGRVANGSSALLRVAAAIWAQAQALVANNVQPVGSGVEVRLVRIDDSNIVDGEIRGGSLVATTTTDANGRYAVRLPNRTSPDTCRFYVEVGSSSGRTLTRALVYQQDVDIDFESEATLRLLLQQMQAGATTLCDLSTQDIKLVYDAVVDSDRQVFGDSAAAVNASATVVAASDPAVQAAIQQAVGIPTPVPTSTNTVEPAPPTATQTAPGPTATGGAPTRTATSVRSPTGGAATRTFTSVPTETSPPTRTATSEPTVTSGAGTPTATNTGAPTNTAGPSNTAAPSATNTPTVAAPTNTSGFVTATPTTTAVVSTSTVTAVPTNTAPATATATAVVTPTTPAAQPQVNLGVVAATAGAIVSVPATLVTSGAQIAAVASDIEFDTAAVDVVTGSGGPDCTIDSRLAGQKDVVADTAVLGGGRKRLRVGIIGTDNNTAISSGPLYSCRFAVTLGAPATIALENTSEASDPFASPVAVGGSDGRIEVSAAPPTLGLVAGTVGGDGVVAVTAQLNARGQALAAVSTDIAFDPDVLAVVDADQNPGPDCVVDPAVAALGKEVFATAFAAGDQSVLRVGLVGTDNNTALPDTGSPVALFECRFDVLAPPATIVLEHSPEAAAPDAQAVGLVGEPATITAP